MEPGPPFGTARHSLTSSAPSLVGVPGGTDKKDRNSCRRLALRGIAWHRLPRVMTASLGSWLASICIVCHQKTLVRIDCLLRLAA